MEMVWLDLNISLKRKKVNTMDAQPVYDTIGALFNETSFYVKRRLDNARKAVTTDRKAFAEGIKKFPESVSMDDVLITLIFYLLHRSPGNPFVISHIHYILPKSSFDPGIKAAVSDMIGVNNFPPPAFMREDSQRIKRSVSASYATVRWSNQSNSLVFLETVSWSPSSALSSSPVDWVEPSRSVDVIATGTWPPVSTAGSFFIWQFQNTDYNLNSYIYSMHSAVSNTIISQIIIQPRRGE